MVKFQTNKEQLSVADVLMIAEEAIKGLRDETGQPVMIIALCHDKDDKSDTGLALAPMGYRFLGTRIEEGWPEQAQELIPLLHDAEKQNKIAIGVIGVGGERMDLVVREP
jgi:hypothetical protein